MNPQLLLENNLENLIEQFKKSSFDEQLEILIEFTRLNSMVNPQYSEDDYSEAITLEEDLSIEKVKTLIHKYGLSKINDVPFTLASSDPNIVDIKIDNQPYVGTIYTRVVDSLINDWDYIFNLIPKNILSKETDIDLKNIKLFNENGLDRFSLSLNIKPIRSLCPIWENSTGVNVMYNLILEINKTIFKDISDHNYDDYYFNTILPKKEYIESTYNVLLDITRISENFSE